MELTPREKDKLLFVYCRNAGRTTQSSWREVELS